MSRLLAMDSDEILERSRQELRKRSDTILARLGVEFAREVGQLSCAEAGRFFFAPDSVDRVVALLRQRLPQQVSQIVLQADKICHHRFDLLGYENVDYGQLIDWHLDRVHGKWAPKKPFYKVRYLDFQEVGDSKVTWELNRHQHLVTLAKAYRLTGGRRYADEIFQQWQHWHGENPYGVGINWASNLEVAFRSISWLWLRYLLEGTPVAPPAFHGEWLRAQALNGRHIERYLSTYFSPNTHLLGEAVALFFLGVLCPEIPDAGRWKSTGWEIVLQEARRQVLPDGCHFEQSTYYHVYALDFLLHAAILARVNGVAIPIEFEATLQRMLRALLLLGRAGSPPRLGDDDGGRVFDPRRNRDEHLLDPLATGAVLFRDGELKQVAGELREETIWLLGEQGVDAWDGLECQPTKMASAALPSAGLYLFAAPSPGCQWVINTGPRDSENAAHGHADSLSVCLQSNGYGLLIDPGTLEYISRERDRFRSTAMHSTLRVDDQSQSEPAGPFAWSRHAHSETERWIQGDTFDFLVASHDGYARLNPSILHRRYFFAAKSGLLLLRDVVQGTGNHRLDIAWHLAAGMRPGGEHRFGVAETGEGLAILPVEGHGWAEEIRSCSWSPSYGRKQEAMALNFGVVAGLPVEFVTLMAPLKEGSEPPGRLTRMQGQEVAGAVKSYQYETATEDYFFFFGEAGKPWKQGSLAADAEFVCRNRKRGKNDQAVIFCNGSYLEIDGRRVVDCGETVPHRELVLRDGSQGEVCSELG